MENSQNIKECSGRCEMCNINQRTYCSAQKAYYLEQELIEIKALLTSKDNGVIETIIAKESVVSKVPSDID